MPGHVAQAEINLDIFLRIMAGESVHKVSVAYREAEFISYDMFGHLLNGALENLQLKALPVHTKGFIDMGAETFGVETKVKWDFGLPCCD